MAVPIAGNVIMGTDGEGVVRFRIVNAGEAQGEPNIEIIPEPGAWHGLARLRLSGWCGPT